MTTTSSKPTDGTKDQGVSYYNRDVRSEIREQILTEFKQVLKLAPADYTENCTNVVMSILDRVRIEARADERTQVYYVCHDIMSDKRIPRYEVVRYLHDLLAQPQALKASNEEE